MTKGLFLLLNKRFLTTSAFLIFAFSLFFNSTTLLAITQEEQEAIWRAELAQTEQDIAKWQSILNSTKANTASLQQEAAVLNAKIKQAQALIKQRNIAIEQLGKDINKTVTKKGELENKIE